MTASRLTLASLALAFAASIGSGAAGAAMYLDKSEVLFKAGEPTRQDLVVTNPDSEPLYAKVEVTEVLNAGMPNEERHLAREAEDIHLLATPNKLIVPPGESKVVRLVNMAGNGDRERVFRVKVTPVVGKIQPEEGKPRVAVKIVVAYDILVVVAPAKPEPRLEAKRVGRSITFRNDGNTNIFLFNGQQCPAEDAAPADNAAPPACKHIEGNRIYPGNVWTTDLPDDAPVDFSLTVLDTNERRRFE